MEANVPLDTLNKATKCKHNCVCQTEGGKPYCQISETVNGTVFFVNSRHPNGCSYQHAFGSVFMCTCPVRQEIYTKLHI
ncbi:hypothetical protein PDESU_05421 [Pontiella desulfatans]|uniref:Uncharacterized protein n=1 Tax=Pontiella desulfatans TaxID=2750659 RepID=A0A6C2UAB4_PONDE|nr:hypothetical protein [Pontiella desulfatans]VGO16829.1 hypothetical protein PDESU_05421 [Pontiella desulfatans]